MGGTRVPSSEVLRSRSQLSLRGPDAERGRSKERKMTALAVGLKRH
jgi:hypothetical protein